MIKRIGDSKTRKHNNHGFTLIELMVSVGIIAILTATGTSIFLRSLRGSSQIKIRQTLDDRARLITSSLSRFFFEARVVSLDGNTRDVCLTSGQINGDSLVVTGIDNMSTTVSIANGKISSGSAELNADSVTVAHQSGLGYYFSWYCSVGVPDRLIMRFTGTSVGQQGDSDISNDYMMDVTMRNSGQ